MTQLQNEPLCPRQCGNPARVHQLLGILPCDKCVDSDRNLRKSTQCPEFYNQTMQSRVQEQRDRHEADIMPPYTHDGKPSEEFARANPAQAKQLFSEYERVTGQKGLT